MKKQKIITKQLKNFDGLKTLKVWSLPDVNEYIAISVTDGVDNVFFKEFDLTDYDSVNDFYDDLFVVLTGLQTDEISNLFFYENLSNILMYLIDIKKEN